MSECFITATEEKLGHKGVSCMENADKCVVASFLGDKKHLD